MVKLFCLTKRKSGNQLWQLGPVQEICIILRGHISFVPPILTKCAKNIFVAKNISPKNILIIFLYCISLLNNRCMNNNQGGYKIFYILLGNNRKPVFRTRLKRQSSMEKGAASSTSSSQSSLGTKELKKNRKAPCP